MTDPARADASADPVPPPGPVAPGVVISEVMYHPVLETDEDLHEFVELHNSSAKEVPLAGWKLQGDVTFTFPDGAKIAAKGYVVVARSRDALAAVTKYQLVKEALFGDYSGELDNGRGRISLVDGGGKIVDALTYHDELPWPLAADALGAGESWLPADRLPLDKHRFLGASLERARADVSSAEIANWVPSPIDGATPGRENAAVKAPLAIVEVLSAAAEGATQENIVRSTQKVIVQARFSKLGAVRDAAVEFFVDDLEREDDAAKPLTLPLEAGDVGHKVTLPAQADNAIVRYRIVGDRGNGREVISPRPSDPYAWHAYFVSPPLTSKTPVYQIFISSKNWTAMWTNVGTADNSSKTTFMNACVQNPKWNEHVPAVLVYEGKVYDVQTRYSGSRWHRRTGSGGEPDMYQVKTFAWNRVGPAWPKPLQVLSWHVKFPRYGAIEGRDGLKLNKLLQSCPGTTAMLASQLYAAAGVPVSAPRYVRVHVNGGYYGYMLQHDANVDIIKRATKGQPLGDLFKVQGTDLQGSKDIDIGPYGWGDARVLDTNPLCRQYPPAARYPFIYSRKTKEWRDTKELQQLIEELEQARTTKDQAVIRKFLADRFDLAELGTYFALRNWSAAIDDTFQNHFFYKRPDGKWILTPWDVDREFGGWLPANASFFHGEEKDRSSWNQTWWNRLKDAYFKAYRKEFQQRLVELDKTILTPANVAKLVDGAMATYDRDEAKAAPIGLPCDVDKWIRSIKQFAVDRSAEVKKLPAP